MLVEFLRVEVETNVESPKILVNLARRQESLGVPFGSTYQFL